MTITLLLILLMATVISTIIAEQYACPTKEAVSISPDNAQYLKKPNVNGNFTFFGGKIDQFSGEVEFVTSPIIDTSTGQRAVIGKIAQMTGSEALEVLASAKAAWNRGRGIWPQMSVAARIAAMERVFATLKQSRQEIINVLMWEICKNADDAAAEFDRTVLFFEATVAAFKQMLQADGNWRTVSGIVAKVRRAAIGIMMCLGPYNYPLNETYATLLPALLAGNIVIMKVPTVGGLVHMLTAAAFSEHLPPGTMNFVTGAGRNVMGPIMSSGDVDVLAFIGGSRAADLVIQQHPHPHRLKLFMQLEGKNLGIVMPDADITVAVDQVTLGATSFNGQRCTAIKLVMVHKSIADVFVQQLATKISNLKAGLPWESGVLITPLPEPKKPSYLQDLLADAVAQGAAVVNADRGGGELAGALMRPAVVYPVTAGMRLWSEEQFGPVVPVAVYEDIEEVYEYIAAMPYGQQAAIFTADARHAAPVLDVLSTVVGRININTQCGRSPDVLPFSGRRSSALGTMSVTEALKFFSIETVIASKSSPINEGIVRDLDNHSIFLAPL